MHSFLKTNPLEAFSHVVTRMGRLKPSGGGRTLILREGESEGEVPIVRNSTWGVIPQWLCLGFMEGLECSAKELGFCHGGDGEPLEVLGKMVA